MTQLIRSPFLVEGPAVISFSGGRTSAYMLRRILDEGLQPDVHVLFADTGMERQETYDFVSECERRWEVPIHRVKRAGREGEPEKASPFEQILSKRPYLPGGGLRFCTTELKIRPMKYWMRAKGYEHWDMVVGIRADEPQRIANMRVKPRERWEHVMPLADAGITEADVLAFWKRQPFDLQLLRYEGNCNLCHIKGEDKLVAILRAHPKWAAWWSRQEERTKKQFRRGKSYAQLLARALEENAAGLPMPTEAQLSGAIDDLGDCVCHD